MKMKSRWVAGALTLAFVCAPFAFAGSGTFSPSPMSSPMSRSDQMKAMAGYRNWTVAQMMALQKALTAQGFPVQADGKWGKATRMAIMDFQKKNGLRPTGFPNQATVKKLGLTPP